MENYYTIKVLSQCGEYYDNAFVQNDFDAIQIYRLYTECLGYSVQVWHKGKDITSMVGATTQATVKGEL